MHPPGVVWSRSTLLAIECGGGGGDTPAKEAVASSASAPPSLGAFSEGRRAETVVPAAGGVVPSRTRWVSWVELPLGASKPRGGGNR